MMTREPASAAERKPASSCSHVHGDAPAMVAILWFHHHRQPERAGDVPGVIDVIHRLTFWHGNASRGQQLLGQLFVLCNRLRDGAGPVHFRRLNPALPAAPAELDKAAFAESVERDSAFQRGRDN